MTNVHEIVTVLLGNVTNVHSSLGDEIAKLTVEVSKLRCLFSRSHLIQKWGGKWMLFCQLLTNWFRVCEEKSAEEEIWWLVEDHAWFCHLVF